MRLMGRVILVKHAKPTIDPNVDACMWLISSEGLAAAERLADRLTAYEIDTVISSDEPKAEATAGVICSRVGLDLTTVPGLREHDRRGVGWMAIDELREKVRLFFANPSDLVFGNESADDAYARFRHAVTSSLQPRSFNNAAVVADGTVIALYVSRLAGVEPFALWKRLGHPSYVVMSWPQNRLLEVVDAV